MENQTFTEFWGSLTPTEKDELSIALSDKCNSALSTVKFWGLGYRTPKERSQEIIARHIKDTRGYETDCKTLFPN